MLTTLVAGLSLGAIYCLVAIGYSLIYTTTGVFNFAHPQLVMLGTFIAYWGIVTMELPIVVVFLVAGLVVGLVALIVEKIAIGPLQGRGAHGELLTTVGVATLLDGVTSLIWGREPLRVPFFGAEESMKVFGTSLGWNGLLLIATAAVAAVGVHQWSRRSMMGLTSLATAEDREAARLRGINVRMLSVGIVVATGVFAGLTGPILGPSTYAVVSLAPALAIRGFIVMFIGGLGNPIGVLIGGMTLGMIEVYGGLWIGDQYRGLIVLAVLLTVLLAKPSKERVV